MPVGSAECRFEETGPIFWGYGGNTCHPLTMVQPFVKDVAESGNQVLVVMQKMDPKHSAPPEIAKQYSDDGVDWQPIPKGIEIRGSRYALVLDELRMEEFELNLSELQVGVRPNRGRKGNQYLVNRVDKGCFLYTPEKSVVLQDQQSTVPIGLVACVKPPYAVLLKT